MCIQKLYVSVRPADIQISTGAVLLHKHLALALLDHRSKTEAACRQCCCTKYQRQMVLTKTGVYCLFVQCVKNLMGHVSSVVCVFITRTFRTLHRLTWTAFRFLCIYCQYNQRVHLIEYTRHRVYKLNTQYCSLGLPTPNVHQDRYNATASRGTVGPSAATGARHTSHPSSVANLTSVFCLNCLCSRLAGHFNHILRKMCTLRGLLNGVNIKSFSSETNRKVLKMYHANK